MLTYGIACRVRVTFASDKFCLYFMLLYACTVL